MFGYVRAHPRNHAATGRRVEDAPPYRRADAPIGRTRGPRVPIVLPSPALPAAGHERAEVALARGADCLHRVVVGPTSRAAFVRVARFRRGVDLDRVVAAGPRTASHCSTPRQRPGAT